MCPLNKTSSKSSFCLQAFALNYWTIFSIRIFQVFDSETKIFYIIENWLWSKNNLYKGQRLSVMKIFEEKTKLRNLPNWNFLWPPVFFFEFFSLGSLFICCSEMDRILTHWHLKGCYFSSCKNVLLCVLDPYLWRQTSAWDFRNKNASD